MKCTDSYSNEQFSEIIEDYDHDGDKNNTIFTFSLSILSLCRYYILRLLLFFMYTALNTITPLPYKFIINLLILVKNIQKK